MRIIRSPIALCGFLGSSLLMPPHAGAETLSATSVSGFISTAYQIGGYVSMAGPDFTSAFATRNLQPFFMGGPDSLLSAEADIDFPFKAFDQPFDLNLSGQFISLTTGTGFITF